MAHISTVFISPRVFKDLSTSHALDSHDTSTVNFSICLSSCHNNSLVVVLLFLCPSQIFEGLSSLTNSLKRKMFFETMHMFDIVIFGMESGGHKCQACKSIRIRKGQMNDADLAQELSNPIADLITLPIQINYNWK
ncbi:unknown protein [Desulfotalea psychrophila LSv54]|uniref:Uncharacterized protein n=1 Tax=Desulfotalea psychrophila (strain LSv54 / DSM 12343) TaxID=177439 RepID=Q6AKY3_DESPS|nr:unknown protein [Desulfotalea psychrophila LSv54]